jgi:protein phosphatase-4 regulatory subunit 3
MLSLLINRIDTDPETGVKILLFEILKHLCDTNGLDELSVSFLNLFYTKFVPLLFSPLARPLPKSIHTEEEALLKNSLCEFLAGLLPSHGQWIITYILNSFIVKNILNLLNAKERWLVLASIRFVRTLLLIESNPITNFIINEHIFEPIINVFIKNGAKYNLVESAILELFEWIIKKKNKPIMKYLVEKFYNRFKDNSHFSIFQTLKEISEKGDSPVHEHNTPNSTSPTPETRLRTRKCILDDEEYWIDTNNEDGTYNSISDYKDKDKQKKRQIGDDDTGYSHKDSPMKKKQKAISTNGKQPNTEKL